ncbi:MAG: ABC transporter substrate-binding protein [Paralcaligenes sp.]
MASEKDSKRNPRSIDLVSAEGRPISRRQFGGLLLGAGASLAGWSVLQTTYAATATASTEPKKGGRVRIALNSQGANDTFDGARALNPGDFIRCASIFSYLTRMDVDGKALPEVAESFESRSDGKEWVFQIAKGIVYSDGSPLKMEDIVFSILRHQEKQVVSSAKQLVANIKAVKADGPQTIVVELLEADADIPVTLSTSPFTIVKSGTYDFSKPIGTGPFIIKEFTPGVRTICVRNDKYWKSGQPYIDEFEMFPIVDQVARANALLSGDVQMAIDIRGPSIAQLKGSTTAQPFITKAPRYTAIQGAVNMAPANNPNLGLALSYLIDRERVLRTSLLGNGVIANDFPIISGSPYCNTALEQRKTDPDKAKFYLAKSGVGKNRVPLHVSDASAFSVDIGQILQREATNIGLNLDLKKEPADSYWSAIVGKRPFFATTFNPRPTYNILLNLTWKTGAPWNFSHYSNPALDSLIDQARATVDEPKRIAIYHEIDAILHNSGALILPAFINFVDGLSNRVKGLKPIPIAPMGGCFFTDQIWLES